MGGPVVSQCLLNWQRTKEASCCSTSCNQAVKVQIRRTSQCPIDKWGVVQVCVTLSLSKLVVCWSSTTWASPASLIVIGNYLSSVTQSWTFRERTNYPKKDPMTWGSQWCLPYCKAIHGKWIKVNILPLKHSIIIWRRMRISVILLMRSGRLHMVWSDRIPKYVCDPRKTTSSCRTWSASRLWNVTVNCEDYAEKILLRKNFVSGALASCTSDCDASGILRSSSRYYARRWDMPPTFLKSSALSTFFVSRYIIASLSMWIDFLMYLISNPHSSISDLLDARR